MELPLAYINEMKALLGEEYEDYLVSFEEVRLYGLRANTLKISPAELAEKGEFSLSPVPWCESGFYYAEGERPAKHPYYHAGLYYLQEPSAMTPGAMIPIEEGDFVLDICAAPGGKTTQLAARLGGTGLLISNDISAGRAKALLKNVEISGITNAIVMSEPPKKLAERFGGFFDKILIDAPCSGEGMFRKEPDMVKSWNEELLTFCGYSGTLRFHAENRGNDSLFHLYFCKNGKRGQYPDISGQSSGIYAGSIGKELGLCAGL